MNIDEIKELMAHLEKSKLSKMIVKKKDFELHLEKESASFVPVRRSSSESYIEIEPEAPKKVEMAKGEEAGLFVTSPMVGTCYSSPGPDQPVFVKVGDKVSEGTVVCIVEAMKVMNEVKAGMSGTIAEVLIHNAQPVEFGTRLFRIVK